jgi:purine-binding chemotaxis protein CheW
VQEQQDILRVIIQLKDKFFSLRADQVLSMEVLNIVREVPQSPNYIRGIVDLRGRLMPLVDLRKVLGLGSFLEDNTQEKELFTVIQHGDKEFAITVDSIVAVDFIKINNDTQESVYDFLQDKLRVLIESIGENSKVDGLILNLNIVELYNHLNLKAL